MAHPVSKITRLGEGGYGVRRQHFTAKTFHAPSPHPVHKITRMSMDGYGARRCTSFAGRLPGTGAAQPTSTPNPQIVTVGRLMSR